MENEQTKANDQRERGFPVRTVAFAGALVTAMAASELGVSDGVAIAEGIAVLLLGRKILSPNSGQQG